MGRAESIIHRFPDFYQSKDAENVFHQFIGVFGQTLDQVETDLLKVMRAHWVDTADNKDSKGFNTTQKGDLDKIFSLYLENLGGTSQLKQVDRRGGPDGLIDDALYRERIKGLIDVLKRGASTKEGIIAIVAANLGIVGDDEAAVKARRQIRIVEFLPEPFKTDLGDLALYETFVVENPNAVSTTPEIRIGMQSDLPVPLINPRIVNLDTGGFAQYNGTVSKDDALSFFPDGTAFLNGILIPIEGETPSLPPGESRWRFEALFGLAEGHFDQSLFDYAVFEEERLNQVGVFDLAGSCFDEAVFAFGTPAIALSMTLFKLTPASFMVRIPWDIPGFTDHNQIKYIVNKVKAAGVFAVIAYEKQFTEAHELADFLTMLGERQPFEEEHIAEEANFDIGSVQTPYPGGLEHELSDALVTSGVFDYTTFDSLNTFA
jgi:hypothetical protein